jgi:hypothetical protein
MTRPQTSPATCTPTAGTDDHVMCAQDMFWQGYVANPAMSGMSPRP